jgi:hypothetical protein
MYWPNEKSPSILDVTWTIPAAKKAANNAQDSNQGKHRVPE